MGWLSNYANKELEALYSSQFRKHKWLIIVFFVTFAVIVCSIIYWLIALPVRLEKKLELKSEAVKTILMMERGYVDKIKPLGNCFYPSDVYGSLFETNPRPTSIDGRVP